MGALLDGAVAQNGEFQAAAAKIDDAARQGFGAQSGEDGFAAETGFFRGADDFQGDAGFLPDSAEESVAVTGFARGAGGYRAIFGYAEVVHDFFKMGKGFYGFLEKFFAEAVAQENAFSQAKRVALVVKSFDVESGIGAGHGEAHGVGAGVDGGDIYRIRHGGSLAPEMGERGARSVLGRAYA